MWRKGNPSVLLMGMQTGAATMENTIEFSMYTIMSSANNYSFVSSFQFGCLLFPFLVWLLWLKLPILCWLYPKNPETPIQKNLCTPMFTAAQFTIVKCLKHPRCPSANEWIKKLWYIYTMEIYAAEIKELIPFATAWMELESTMLSEISQAVRDKYHMISPLTGT